MKKLEPLKEFVKRHDESLFLKVNEYVQATKYNGTLKNLVAMQVITTQEMDALQCLMTRWAHGEGEMYEG